MADDQDRLHHARREIGRGDVNVCPGGVVQIFPLCLVRVVHSPVDRRSGKGAGLADIAEVPAVRGVGVKVKTAYLYTPIWQWKMKACC